MIHRSTMAAHSRLAARTLPAPHPRTIRQPLVVPRAATEEPKPSSAASTSAPTPSPASSSAPTSSAPYSREFRALGSKVIESDQPFEEPPAQDMWEGESFEAFGQVLERWFLPGLVVLGLVCGGYAASSYNNDADVFIKPAAGPDVPVEVVPASAIQAPPVAA